MWYLAHCNDIYHHHHHQHVYIFSIQIVNCLYCISVRDLMCLCLFVWVLCLSGTITQSIRIYVKCFFVCECMRYFFPFCSSIWRLCIVIHVQYYLFSHSYTHSLALSRSYGDHMKKKRAILHWYRRSTYIHTQTEYIQVDAVEYGTYVISFVHHFAVEACE